MTITVTGQTFDHRETLKRFGGRWDATERNWKFDYVRPKDLAELKNLPGCLVTNNDEPPWSPPQPSDDGDDDSSALDIITKLLGTFNDDDKPCEGRTPAIVYGDDERYLNHFKDKNPVAFFGFSSVGELCKFVEAIPQHKRDGERNVGWTGKADWAGTSDMKEAIRLARDGWQKGAENAAKVIELLTTDHALQRRRSHSVAGGSVSVGRMLAGNPSHMVKRPKQPGRKVVTLFVENVASSYIQGQSLTVRAAVVAALADIMERHGFSCEIVSLSTVAMDFTNTKPGAQTAVTIKHAGEKLNINDLAFALGHPSFLRRMTFALVSQCDELRRIWGNQGCPTEAFNSYYPTGRNEFYIKRLTENVKGETLEQMALKMLPIVKPDNLPVEIVT